MGAPTSTKAYQQYFRFTEIERPVVRLHNRKIVPHVIFTVKNHGKVTVDEVIRYIKTGDERFLGYEEGLFTYAMKCHMDDIKWDMKKTHVGSSIAERRFTYLLKNNNWPGYLRNECIDIWNNPPMSFEDYVRLCSDRLDLQFDLESCLNVYKMQGERSIPVILHQMFYNFPYKFSVLPDKDLKCKVPNISQYISGVAFPCLVSEKPSKLECKSHHGCISLMGLFDDEWKVFDMYCVGNFCLFDKGLGERLAFFSAGGECCKSFVCWNYLDLVEAWHNIGEDCVVRSLRENLLVNNWFVWGWGSWINVFVNWRNRICGTDGTTDIVYEKEKMTKKCITIDMMGNFKAECSKNDLCYSSENILDFLELLNM